MTYVQKWRPKRWWACWRRGARRVRGAHTVRRIDDKGREYHVGRYVGINGWWAETDEFYTEQEAITTARAWTKCVRDDRRYHRRCNRRSRR